MKKISIVFLMLFFCSCTHVLFLFSDIHSPRIENRQSILNFANEAKIHSDVIYVIKDTSSVVQIHNYVRGIPKLFLFNKEGQQLEIPRSGDYCTYKVEKIIDTMDWSSLKIIDSSSFGIDMLEHLMPIKGEDYPFEKEYMAAVFWATYTGRKNNINAPAVWIDMLKDRPDVDTRVINLDLFEEWGKIEYSVKHRK